MGADEDKMERMREEAARLTKGWDQERVKDIVAEVLEEVITPLIYAEALELMHDHREAGRLICIVSSSPSEIVEPMADMLRADRWIATLPKVEDGKYTGELEFYAYGPFKAEAIRQLAADERIDLDGSFAYSDSVTDLPMLESVGNPVVVNPDKELRALAEERGWMVQLFRKPVSLRDRLPAFPQLPTFPQFQFRPIQAPEMTARNKAAAAVSLVGVAAVGWWLTHRGPARRTS
jgi:HAD superfamily hydrolase (TIGR01490 family)